MDVDDYGVTSDGLASQACAACRNKKRKCDKKLPACSLCQRLNRQCDYSEEARPAQFSTEDFLSLKNEVAELRNLLASTNGHNTNGHHNGFNGEDNSGIPSVLTPPLSQASWPSYGSTFPNLFFLDSFLFEYQQYQVHPPHIRIPPGALGCLGSSAELRTTVEDYFVTVHSYFPVISKIRLFQLLATPTHEPGADLALLFLAIRLITSDSSDSPTAQNQLYKDIKSFHHHVESQNGFSIHFIQALLLISLYEIGHAIYPAAYLTVGHAGRVGHALGIHELGAPQMLLRCHTWTEQEERRRVWWGVIVLDRYVNIGHRSTPFATSDPSLSTHLPTDDLSWDRGKMLATAPLSLSASTTVKASPFARTCQAAHLLSKVIRHKNDRNLPHDYRFEEALQLNRTVKALVGLLPAEADDDEVHGPTLCSAMAICYSALLALYEVYSCTETSRAITGVQGDATENELIVQKESIDGISGISELVLQLSRRIRGYVEQEASLERVSPFVIECLYAGAANFGWMAKETSEQRCVAGMREIIELLQLVEKRWKAAGEYIRIMESMEYEAVALAR